jgi:SAM-dependent methyltransferase
MTVSSLRERAYPGAATFGFAGSDGSLPFVLRLHSIINAGDRVVDFGAGRGAAFVSATGIKRKLLDFRQAGVTVIGVDVSADVLDNPTLTEAIVTKPGEPLPLADDSIDVVFAEWVCEHLEDPVAAVRDIRRVLKPGGWFAFRTPNRWHYSMLAAQAIPDRHHERVLRVAQPERQAEDIFPKFYRMNSIATCRRVVGQAGMTLQFITTHEPPPAYLEFSAVAFSAGIAYQRLVDGLSLGFLRKNIIGFAQRPN